MCGFKSQAHIKYWGGGVLHPLPGYTLIKRSVRDETITCNSFIKDVCMDYNDPGDCSYVLNKGCRIVLLESYIGIYAKI